MSKITYLTVQESKDLVASKPQIIRELVSYYKKIGAAEASITQDPREYARFYQDAGVGVPLPAMVLQALINAFSGTGSGVSSQQAEANEALQYDVRVATINSQVVHLRTDRKTDVVEVLPADLLTRQCQKHEKHRPGFTEFLGELVSIYDFTGDQMAQWSTYSNFVAVKPVCYDYYQLQVFALARGADLYATPVKDATPKSVIASLIERVGAMDLQLYLEVKTEFYDTLFQWEFNNPDLKQEIPIRQIGTAVVEGVQFFKHPSTARLDKNRTKYYLYRTGPWNASAAPPTTVRAGVTNLGNSRTHRREGKAGYSGYTAGHREGGDFPDIRIDVTRLLSLSLPILDKGADIEIRSTNVEVVKHLVTEYTLLKLSHLVKFVMSEETAINTFGVDHFNTHSVRVRTPQKMFIDMVSAEIPSLPAKSDAEEVWGKHFIVPAAPYIAYRKVPPHLVDKYYVFRFGSSHAYDFIVSSEPDIECRGKIATLENGKVMLKPDTFGLKRIKSKDEALKVQFVDDRRKLELFTNVNQKVTYTTAINLWSPPPFFNKKAQHRIVQTVAQGITPLALVSFTFVDDAPPAQDGGGPAAPNPGDGAGPAPAAQGGAPVPGPGGPAPANNVDLVDFD